MVRYCLVVLVVFVLWGVGCWFVLCLVVGLCFLVGMVVVVFCIVWLVFCRSWLGVGGRLVCSWGVC